ncbi:MAG: DUF4402 domain-containing protein, partial [Sphingomicrobium sp.]
MTYRLAALAAVLATAAPALAAPGSDTATAEARGLVLQPLTLTKVTDLDFGTVIASTVAGTVTIDADGAARAITGGVIGVATAPGNRAEFAGAGTAQQLVTLSMNSPSLLVSTTNASDTLVVSSLGFDSAGTTRTLDSTSAFTAYVGGIFQIGANQANGLYTAQFDV